MARQKQQVATQQQEAEEKVCTTPASCLLVFLDMLSMAAAFRPRSGRL